MFYSQQNGFTLVELLVAISIVGLLAALVLTPLNDASLLARDAKRKASLDQVRTALQLYYNRYDTFQVANSGWNNGGQGWISYENGQTYTRSVIRALAEEGFLNSEDIEDPIQDPGYMIYVCNGGDDYAISATLENPSTQDIAYIQTTCNGANTYGTYGKNYAIHN